MMVIAWIFHCLAVAPVTPAHGSRVPAVGTAIGDSVVAAAQGTEALVRLGLLIYAFNCILSVFAVLAMRKHALCRTSTAAELLTS